MRLSRMQFFFLLIIFFIFPIFAWKIFWILGTKTAIGTMCFMGKQQNGQFVKTYPVIKFSSTGSDTVFFNGTDELLLKPGQAVQVRFRKNDLADARINSFTGLWLDTFIYAAVPFLFLIIVFLHRNIIPRRSVVVLGKKPVIQIMINEE